MRNSGRGISPGCRRSGHTLLEIMIVVAIIGILTLVVLPALLQTRESSMRNACRNNLRVLNDAKQKAAMEFSVLSGPLTWEQLYPYVYNNPMKCPSGGLYEIGDVNGPSRCSVHGDFQ